MWEADSIRRTVTHTAAVGQVARVVTTLCKYQTLSELLLVKISKYKIKQCKQF